MPAPTITGLPQMDLDLRGQTVLITGGSQGIGLATARAFAAEGCHLHLAARTESRLREAKREITEKFGGRVGIHPIDLSVSENARALAYVCREVDILVNNAGAVPGGNLEEIDEASWHTAWNLKVHAYINLTREIYGEMANRSRGVIVNVIGTAGNIVPASYIVGVSGSASLVAFTQALGGVSLDRGVRVIGVSPRRRAQRARHYIPKATGRRDLGRSRTLARAARKSAGQTCGDRRGYRQCRRLSRLGSRRLHQW
jgi:short-subunit dehydrogenase